MEHVGNWMTSGPSDYYFEQEHQRDPEEVAYDESSPCRLCGSWCRNDDMFWGVCKECLVDAVEPYKVREYVEANMDYCDRIWESLLETYFSDPDDKCKIVRVSETLKDRLFAQIVKEWNADRMFGTYGQCVYHAKDRLVAWVGEDDVAWEDFALWLIKKREGKK